MWEYKWYSYWIFWGAVVFVLLFIIFWLIVLGFHVSANACHGWGIQNHRQVRYVQNNWFTRECITNVGRGQWLPTGQVRAY
jgi:hypothetical protein